MAISETLPTEQQRKLPCEMMAAAFIELRELSSIGSARQALDLADAFHNLPREMYGWGRWSWSRFRETLERYQQQYPLGNRICGRDYVAMLDGIPGSGAT